MLTPCSSLQGLEVKKRIWRRGWQLLKGIWRHGRQAVTALQCTVCLRMDHSLTASLLGIHEVQVAEMVRGAGVRCERDDGSLEERFWRKGFSHGQKVASLRVKRRSHEQDTLQCGAAWRRLQYGKFMDAMEQVPAFRQTLEGGWLEEDSCLSVSVDIGTLPMAVISACLWRRCLAVCGVATGVACSFKRRVSALPPSPPAWAPPWGAAPSSPPPHAGQTGQRAAPGCR